MSNRTAEEEMTRAFGCLICVLAGGCALLVAAIVWGLKWVGLL